MKKILLVFLFSTISLLTFSQSKERPTYDTLLRPYSLEPFEILAYDYNYNYSFTFEGSKSLVAKDSKLSKGFEISVNMVQDTVRSKNRFDGLFFKGIRLRMAGIGRNCVEQGSTLVLELEDGEKLSYPYREEFICYKRYDTGEEDFPTIYFDLSQEIWEKLFNTRVKSMTFTEKRTGDSFSYKLKKEEQEFFMEVKEATTRVRRVIL
jgi:hypothetical protein